MSIDMEKQSLRWVRAGHDPAVVYDPIQDNFEELMGTGLALGVDQNFVFEEYPSFFNYELTTEGLVAGCDSFFNRSSVAPSLLDVRCWTFDVRRSICSLFRPGGFSCETWIINSISYRRSPGVLMFQKRGQKKAIVWY
jgi:hypothetical protein